MPGFGTCTASTECTPCGNELVEPGEQCDDGNEVAGDGCSANCQDENCGDGHLGSLPIHRLDLTWLGSNCETGERSLTLSANGSELWRESVVSNCGCTPGIQRRSIAVPSVLRKLKDGKNRFEWAFSGAQGDKLAWAIVRVIGVETKDVVLVDVNGGGDAAANRVDLCAADSEIALSEPIKHVVDVYLNLYEECDDGNQIGGDGCAADCLNEPAATRRLCGNRRIDSSEECDDGNVQSGDGCSSTCMREQ